MNKQLLFILFFTLSIATAVAQNDSIKKKEIKIEVQKDIVDSNLTFTGTKISRENELEETGKVVLSGYVSTYYAYYTDSAGSSGFQKFPTVAPRNNQFGLNIIQFSAKYNSHKFRSIFTLHYGDIPQSSWSSQYNLIQEANVGFKLAKKLWLDAGFFRTHIGVESIQPRENITVSLATVTYYEPYFLSGAKLTYNATDKLTLQVSAFNSYYSFVETNKNKVFGFSAVYDVNKHLSFTFNSITCDETPDNAFHKQQRLYNNLYMVYKGKKLTIGAEVNYGIQQHSVLTDTTATASMFSALFAIKYNIKKGFSVYTRGEYFSDDNEILSGPIINENSKYVGLNLAGVTLGVEEKLIYNSYIRLEGRMLNTLKNDEKIFYYNKISSNQRYEGIVSVGIWF